ncbi:MAG: hypothetical protein IT167_05450 [Bryobacterales bacterium]|nr:hypothetical protein [Bryobacterales bacterium]
MNAIIIEQNQDETRLAFEVNQNAAIRRIRLARAKVASQAMGERATAPISVVFNFKSKEITAPAGILRLEIAFRMTGVEEKEERKRRPAGKKVGDKRETPVVLVECAYEVDYLLREGFLITPEHVHAFKEGNGIFNVWPYFREYLQNNLQRMGLPPLTVPFLRLLPKPKTRRGEKPEHEAEKTLPGQSRQ